MVRYFALLAIAFLAACSSGPSFDMSEEEIDEYVESVLDTAKIYDIAQGLRFSRDDESYQVTEYSQYDTVVLYNSMDETESSQTILNIYFKEELPIFIEEYIYEYPEEYSKVTERRIYLTGSDILQAYERSAEYETEIDEKEYEKVDLNYADYDFDRPKRAVNQEGEFEMKYGEFLIINPESYLILENEDSKYGVALYIMEGDMLLDELFAKPNDYLGKSIFVHHEFRMMGGIERMIYRGGIVKETESL